MKLLFMKLFLMANGFAAIQTEGEWILPFERKGLPLNEFIKEYAEALKIHVSYPEKLLKKEGSKIDLYLHAKTSMNHFSALVQSILASSGYTLIQEEGFQWITNARDVRHLPVEFFANDQYPKDERFVTVLFRLKYPIASNITKVLRPFLSRYGRVVNLSDGRSIILQEKGDKVKHLKETIQFMDTDEVYRVSLEKEAKDPKEEIDPTNEKIVELELKNKILEKKLIKQNSGETHEVDSNPNTRRR